MNRLIPKQVRPKKLLCRAGANEDIHVRLGIVFRKETKGRKTNTAANKKNLMVAPVKTASQRTHDTDRIPFSQLVKQLRRLPHNPVDEKEGTFVTIDAGYPKRTAQKRHTQIVALYSHKLTGFSRGRYLR